MKFRHVQRGVTFWELAVGVFIIGILLAVALPSYRYYILKSHRTEARAILADILTAQENFRTYCGAFASQLGTNENCQTGTIKLGRAANAAFYSASIGVTEDGFVAFATALGDQQGDKSCASMSVQVIKSQVTFDPAGCWK